MFLPYCPFKRINCQISSLYQYPHAVLRKYTGMFITIEKTMTFDQ